MPDPKATQNSHVNHRNSKVSTNLQGTRSYDDVLSLVTRQQTDSNQFKLPHCSVDDLTLHAAANNNEEHIFLHPSCCLPSTSNKSSQLKANKESKNIYPNSALPTTLSTLNRLRPQVSTQKSANKLTRPSLGFEAVDLPVISFQNTNSHNLPFELDGWSSLQDLSSKERDSEIKSTQTSREQDWISSNPDLMKRCAVTNATTSPFQRGFGQSSSFRNHSSNSNSPQLKAVTVRRTASMTASDNNVYIKSMDGCIDELQQQQQPIAQANDNAKKQSSNNSNNNSSSSSNNKSKLPQIIIKMDSSTAATAAADKPLPTGVVSWGSSFERLLEDAAGLQTFAEFLKKEFSAENIYFWTACERYRHCEDVEERTAQAKAIYAKHLANGCPEPVNVDSQARNLSEARLQSADLGIFTPAQKQIFNLMKFDSYQRFIRSDLYKRCLEAEQRKQALPFGADSLEDELLQMSKEQALAAAAAAAAAADAALGNSSKLKKSASNAEDRRRKSLLPWHRKTRSKSRDRNEPPPSNLNISNSLKIPNTQNSMSDLHSSRSSLSSFDTLPVFAGAGAGGTAAATAAAEIVCTLCRVILSDGATTIVQTRANETVQQLIDRLLEKRGLNYQYYDVVDIVSKKNIEQQGDAKQLLANKEVRIEQRVAFKLELPDPKVILVRSKPKKLLHEVVKPILHKYNHSLDAVQVLLRDTQMPVDLSQPVGVVNGQRLQVVRLQKLPFHADYQNGCVSKFIKPLPPKLNVVSVKPTGFNASTQSTLDEITNKVFNELLQSKVEAQAQADKQQLLQPNSSDKSSLKSDDCASETSSIFERMRKRDSNIPGLRFKGKKKSSSSQNSDEPISTTCALVESKKPIIAKLKAGVKLQVTERVAENADELLEGLKRAQLARLEDQRGTEINFELPEFLKNKENLNAAACKLRKVRANLSPVHVKQATISEEPSSSTPPIVIHSPTTMDRPQPAPRLSITNRNRSGAGSNSNPSTPMKIDEEQSVFNASAEVHTDLFGNKAPPPPLPPKPKVLPIKPSNWGVVSTLAATFDANGKSGTSGNSSGITTPTATTTAANGNNNNNNSNSNNSSNSSSSLCALQPSKIPIDITRKNSQDATVNLTSRCAYLEEPSSSFV